MNARRVVLVTALALTAAGCSAADDEALGGSGLAKQIAGEEYTGPAFDEAVTFAVAPNGCHTVVLDGTAHAVIWPQRATDPDPATVIVDDLTVADGDGIRVSGRAVSTAALPGGPDGYWASVMGFCALPDPVLVVDRVEAAP